MTSPTTDPTAADPADPAGPPPEDAPLLTDRLRHWAAERAARRAFTQVDFPEPDSPGVHRTLGWRSLDERARAVAGLLTRTVRPADRVALLLPQGLDYAVAFLGCLYAGVVAVPLFGPELPGHAGRLAAVLEDCEPACVLTDGPSRTPVEAFVGPRIPVLDVREPGAAPPAAELPRPERADVAYLQYTSGSTRSPSGVMVTHANIAANARQAVTAFGAAPGRTTTVGWLPLFHDMGLVLSVAAPVYAGFASVLLDPVAFLERPVRWLRLLGGYPGTIGAAPNFAYDYCVARVAADEVAGLRLDRVAALLNGSEPVRPATLERFRTAFAAAGLAPRAVCPAYGLAEATVFVTAADPAAPSRPVECDAAALAAGRIEPGGTARLADCGRPAGQEVRITDPGTDADLGADRVGEITVRGPNVGAGYWKQPGRTAATFRGGWLRTGDLGALHEGRLLVTGRLKDLIVVDGRNHYPQDVEDTVQQAVELVRRDRLAAFLVPGPAGADERDGADGGEELVVVAETRRGAEPDGPAVREAVGAARGAVAAGHGLRLAALVLVPAGAVPRTSSGKVARAACRARFLAGELRPFAAEAAR
ncbi:fatty acyl-AMP ligase [Streptomyces sp. NPDC088785]|uniref:fatty acyl-AMP ligase n=1 Tax=Streptomyces sp. NPDC088785 TaxID=3365897 RepID=UPI00380EF835